MNRREARISAMQYIFQMEGQGDFSSERLEAFLSDKDAGSQRVYITSIVDSVCKNIEAIDRIIGENSSGWAVSRLAKADLAILRLSAAEIMFCDIPKSVSINEAVELAKTFGDDKSPGFVNAVLKNIG